MGKEKATWILTYVEGENAESDQEKELHPLYPSP